MTQLHSNAINAPKTRCCQEHIAAICSPRCYAGTPTGKIIAWGKRGGNGGRRKSPNRTALMKVAFKLRHLAPWIPLSPFESEALGVNN